MRGKILIVGAGACLLGFVAWGLRGSAQQEVLLARVLAQQTGLAKELARTRSDVRARSARLATLGTPAPAQAIVQAAVREQLQEVREVEQGSGDPAADANDPEHEGEQASVLEAKRRGEDVLREATASGHWDPQRAAAYREQLMQLSGAQHEAMLNQLIMKINRGELRLDPDMRALF